MRLSVAPRIEVSNTVASKDYSAASRGREIPAWLVEDRRDIQRKSPAAQDQDRCHVQQCPDDFQRHPSVVAEVQWAGNLQSTQIPRHRNDALDVSASRIDQDRREQAGRQRLLPLRPYQIVRRGGEARAGAAVKKHLRLYLGHAFPKTEMQLSRTSALNLTRMALESGFAFGVETWPAQTLPPIVRNRRRIQ